MWLCFVLSIFRLDPFYVEELFIFHCFILGSFIHVYNEFQPFSASIALSNTEWTLTPFFFQHPISSWNPSFQSPPRRLPCSSFCVEFRHERHQNVIRWSISNLSGFVLLQRITSSFQRPLTAKSPHERVGPHGSLTMPDEIDSEVLSIV